MLVLFLLPGHNVNVLLKWAYTVPYLIGYHVLWHLILIFTGVVPCNCCTHHTFEQYLYLDDVVYHWCVSHGLDTWRTEIYLLPIYQLNWTDMWYIENTRWVSFDIKFTRQGFENACWHREARRAIQHAFSKPSLVNLISKDASLVFYLSVYPLLNTLQTSDYDVIFDFCVDSVSLATSFKKCNVIMTW